MCDLRCSRFLSRGLQSPEDFRDTHSLWPLGAGGQFSGRQFLKLGRLVVCFLHFSWLDWPCSETVCSFWGRSLCMSTQESTYPKNFSERQYMLVVVTYSWAIKQTGFGVWARALVSPPPLLFTVHMIVDQAKPPKVRKMLQGFTF